jgi:hydroxymethylglutaryl-CoA lyase
MNRRVYIQEVVPRDGLQNEGRFVPTDDKVALVNRLSRSGVDKIEVTAFVSPKAVPQMKDAATVLAKIERLPEVTYAALVPNGKGAEKAVHARADEINVVMSVSRTHNLQNVKRTHQQSLQECKSVMDIVKGTGISVNGTLSTTFGCPFEGEIALDEVLRFVEHYVNLGMDGVTLADTTGMAHPIQVKTVAGRVREEFPQLPLTLHFHNTRGMGLANVVAGLEAGVNRFDASLGGLGGCPFAPGATGNICTEDTVNMLELMGYHTGVDLDLLVDIARTLPRLIGHEIPGQVVKAGKITDLHPIPDV